MPSIRRATAPPTGPTRAPRRRTSSCRRRSSVTNPSTRSAPDLRPGRPADAALDQWAPGGPRRQRSPPLAPIRPWSP